jgi:hypothetical protein
MRWVDRSWGSFTLITFDYAGLSAIERDFLGFGWIWVDRQVFCGGKKKGRGDGGLIILDQP